ncbi:MAG: hypothetical protein AAGF07_03520 [Patescibacteria group bacterium]
MSNNELPKSNNQESVTAEYQNFLKSSFVGNKVMQNLIARAFDNQNVLDQKAAIANLTESIKSPVTYEFIACDPAASYSVRLFCLLSILSYPNGDQILEELINRSLIQQTNEIKLPPDSLALAKFLTSTENDAGYSYLASFIRQFLMPSLGSVSGSSFELKANGVDPKNVDIKCFARDNSLVYTTTLNDKFSDYHYSKNFTGETNLDVAFGLSEKDINEYVENKVDFADIPSSMVNFLSFNLQAENGEYYGPVGFSKYLMPDLQSKNDFMDFSIGDKRHGFINFHHAKKEVLVKAIQIALEQINI